MNETSMFLCAVPGVIIHQHLHGLDGSKALGSDFMSKCLFGVL